MARLDQPATRPIKLAVTIDDLFQWVGVPSIPGYDATSIARRLTDAFAAHGISGVYAFSNTAAARDDKSRVSLFEHWTGTGHHVGNHTHSHGSLNWLSPKAYVDDIERQESLISKWMDRAPVRYFRHAFDMWGDTTGKRDEVVDYLKGAGYAIAPISLWFYDAQFTWAYVRAQMSNDGAAQSWLRDRFIETALNQLETQTAAARLMFSHEPVHTWLIHGTPIAADCIGEILDAFAARGVQFVSLDEALRDPMNEQQPLVTAKFRNQVQKWAGVKGIRIENTPPVILSKLDAICPVPGMSEIDVMTAFLAGIVTATGAKIKAEDLID